MPKLRRQRQLRDAYRFPGFVPKQIIHGVFGDAQTRVVQLHRRQKKQRVESVVIGIGVTMIKSFKWHATYPVAT